MCAVVLLLDAPRDGSFDGASQNIVPSMECVAYPCAALFMMLLVMLVHGSVCAAVWWAIVMGRYIMSNDASHCHIEWKGDNEELMGCVRLHC